MAVIIPDAFAFPIISRDTFGCVEPIPIFPFKYTKSEAPAKNPLLAL